MMSSSSDEPLGGSLELFYGGNNYPVNDQEWQGRRPILFLGKTNMMR
jgi:hypothetical protein